MALWREGDAHQAAGRLADAERCFRAVAELTANNPHPLDRLAQVLRDQGRLDEAAEFAASAIAAEAGELVFHNTAATIAAARGEDGLAARCYRRALLINPSAGLWAPLASVLYRGGEHEPAARCYGQALVLAPGDLSLMFDLGASWQAARRHDDARVCYRNILRRAPGHAPTLRNLATLAADDGDIEAAETWLRKTLVLGPDQPAVLRQFSIHEINRDAVASAFRHRRQALRLDPSDAESWRAIADAGRRLAPKQPDPGGLGDLVEAMARGVVAAPQLIGPVVELLHLQSGFQAACRVLQGMAVPVLADQLAEHGLPPALDLPVFRTLLPLSLIPSPGIEAALTAARSALLQLAAAGRLEGGRNRAALGGFTLALAEQCLLNEHVFVETPEEVAAVAVLEAALAGRAQWSLPALVLACYRLPGSLDPGEDEAFKALEERHVAARLRERRLAQAIPALTRIDDGVSQAVRDQYEESPYPRWTLLPEPRPQPLAAMLSRRFPAAAGFSALSERPDILIAGCGTGQQALSAAGRYADATILAVDLSLASLAYGERMRIELARPPGGAASAGGATLRFGQADILRLGALDQRFDVIESIGVLHHMDQPMAGWRVLAGLLKPGVVMQIGLYSEIARQPVVRAREMIRQWGLGSGAEDIREARRRLMQDQQNPEVAALFISPDFYSLSTCRDLLFHVQEHRFSVSQLAESIADLGREFLGFELSGAAWRLYRDRFPGDPDGLDFANWAMFEQENPGYFGSMYRIWLRHQG